MIYLDTHVVIWVYEGATRRLSSKAAARIEAEADLRISPMVRVELEYLYELKRFADPASVVIDALNAAIGLTICQAPFAAVAREADMHGWTRDPFDRLVVAQASMHEAVLLTRDEIIQKHYELAEW